MRSPRSSTGPLPGQGRDRPDRAPGAAVLSQLGAIDPLTLWTFLGAGVMLNLTPGADVLFATASGLRGGWRAGVAAAAGVSLGSLVHTALAAVGLAALIAASPLAYDAIRYAGAAYLLWLAVRTWRAGPPAPGTGAARLDRAVMRGFVTNVLNPKVALFILAFLPQFTDPAIGPVWAQILLLGALFSATGLVITGGYGALAGLASARLSRMARPLNRLAAVVFGAIALRMIWD